MNVDHLHGGEFFEHATRGEAGREGVEAPPQRDMEAVGEEGDEDVRLDPLFKLVEDRADREVAF